MISTLVRSSSFGSHTRPVLSRVFRGGATQTSGTRLSSSTVSNPLLSQESLPRFSEVEAQHLKPAVQSLLAKMKDDFTSFESKLTPNEATYDEILPELERLREPISYVWGVAGHLNGVKNGDELREAYEQSQPDVVKAFTDLKQSRTLYDAMSHVLETDKTLSQAQIRAMESSVKAMKLGGVGLDGDEKVRFNEIKQRLAELSTTFSNNVLDATKAFSLEITDASAMEGVPDSAKAMWAAAASGDADSGPWKLTLDGPSYIAAMQHLKPRDIREKLYRAYVTRASEVSGDKNNLPLIDEILSLKLEASKLLGFENYAEQSLSSKMADSVSAVDDMSMFLREKALPAAEKELQEITDFAKAGGSGLEKLMPWDTTFWSERLKESKFSITEEELRPFFALPAVLDGMFGLAKKIFGIDIKSADGDAEVWNEDVSFFKVFDEESGKHIASFYLDPYSRPANKRGGAWMDVCIGKSAATNRDVPVAYLTCNGSPPIAETPSLMTFREVETLFHEFGHGLQHMLTNVDIGDVAGISGVEWDAVELPSQFMENFCYDEGTVMGFAKHWKTGESLPLELFEKLKMQRTYGAGMMAMRQLYFGQLDMELHARHVPGKGETIFDVQRRVAEIYTPHMPPIEEDRFLCAFNHIFGGGYAAGYYSYKWAEVMSADAYGAFEEVGLENEVEVKRVGRLFRNTVLGYGGGKPPSEVFKEFRGREPSTEALLRHNGLL